MAEVKTLDDLEQQLLDEATAIKGGYIYSGICSYQVCFPLRDGGELRLMISDDDTSDGRLHIDHYSGMLPPGITGPVKKTGES